MKFCMGFTHKKIRFGVKTNVATIPDTFADKNNIKYNKRADKLEEIYVGAGVRPA